MNATNGAAAQQQQINVDPAELARTALMFLARADFKAPERRAFDLCERLLMAIADGSVQVTQPAPNPMPTAMTDAPLEPSAPN